MSQQWVQCPYDPNHRVIAQRLPFHELKCRNNFRGRNAVIENTQTLVESLEVRNSICDDSDLQSYETQSVSTDVNTETKWPSSVSQRSFGVGSITSASFQSFSKDSLRWEKKKIEKNRLARGLKTQPRSASPEYDIYIALCEAIEEKDVVGELENTSSQNFDSISRGRGLPLKGEWKAAPLPGNSHNASSSAYHQQRGFGSCSNSPRSRFIAPGYISAADKPDSVLNNQARQQSLVVKEAQSTKNDSSRNETDVAMRSLQLMQLMKVSPKKS
ncbi:uncharacterized protein LOC142336099 [Convolutriloba macropyga]|uniref:uncharacterized protein LOC142336099 n=1 Tax=Convolutriloba macropyga TaxID=536237 RepID=UPI003F51F6ED